MKKIFLLLLLFLAHFQLMASDFYWVGGNGNWSDFQNHWALSSGGSVFHTTVPSAFDHVFFDANSFPTLNDTMVVIDNAIVFANNLTYTTGLKSVVLNFKPGTAFHIYGSAIFPEKLKFINKGDLHFKATSLGKQLTFNKSKWANGFVTFDGIGGGWDVTDSLTAATQIDLNNGSLNTTGKNIKCYSFYSNNNNNRTWNFANSKMLIYQMSININNLSYTYIGSKIVLASKLINNGTAKFNLDSLYSSNIDYDIIVRGVSIRTLNANHLIMGTSDVLNLYAKDLQIANVTVSNLFLNNGALIIGSLCTVNTALLNSMKSINFLENFTLSNAFSIAGNTCTKRVLISGKIKKSTGTYTFNDAIIENLNASGGASFQAVNSYDYGGNSGINFTALSERTYYWIGNSGSYADPTHWSLSSGGSSVNCIPTLLDDVIFDANSFNNNSTLNVVDYLECKTVDASALDEKLMFSGTIKISGSAYLSPLFIGYTKPIEFKSNQMHNQIDFNGAVMNMLYSQIYFRGGGSWDLIDSLYANNVIHESGDIFSNGQHIHVDEWLQYGGFEDLNHSKITTVKFRSINADMTNTSILFSNGGNLSVMNRVGEIINMSNYKPFLDNELKIGGNPSIGKFSTYGDARFYSSSQIDTFEVSKVLQIYLEEAITLNIDTVINVADVSCGQLISIQGYSTFSNSIASAFVSTNSLSLVLEHFALFSIKTSGPGIFIADQCADMGGNTGWLFNKIQPQKYYWIGNSGDWDDGSHWSLNSGGSAIGCTPGVQDFVFFDDASFSLPNQLVSKSTTDVKLSGLSITNIPLGTNFLVTNFEMYGDVELSPNLVISELQLFFKGRKSTLKSNGAYITTIDTSTDSLILSDNVLGRNFYIKRGFLFAKDLVLDYPHGQFNFGSPYADTVYIDIRNTTINSANTRFYLFHIDVRADSSVFNMKVDNDNPFSVNGPSNNNYVLNLNKITFSRDYNYINSSTFNVFFGNTTTNEIQIDSGLVTARISFNNSLCKKLYTKSSSWLLSSNIGIAQFYNNVKLEGDTHIDYLKLEPGTLLTVNSTDTIHINEYFDAVGTSSYPIAVNSITNGIQAHIKCKTGSICCSYLNMSNIKASGGASFYAGLSSNDLFNNAGWDFTSNCDVLTIDANLPGCEGSPLEITANHSANITGFLWSGPNEFTSNDEVITIASLSSAQTGLYTLQAGGQIRKKIITQETQPDTVLLFDNSLLSLRNSTISPAYGNVIAWYKDGNVIAGQNSSTYTPTSNGDYYATFTSIAGCTFQTNTVNVIVGNENPIYAPFNLMASLNINDKVDLTWNDINSPQDNFLIYRSTDPSTGFVQIGTAYSLTFTDLSQLNIGTYYYKVATTVNGNLSDYSNIVSITILESGINAPFNLVASLNTNNKVNLLWNDINYSYDNFMIYRSINPTSGFLNIGTSYVLSFEDPTQLAPGTYYYKVATTVGGMLSDFSNIANITITVVAVQYSEAQNQLSVKPIPVLDQLTIESVDLRISQVSIYDHMGVLHVDEKVDLSETVVLDLNELKSGMYILKIHTSEGDCFKRFVKQ